MAQRNYRCHRSGAITTYLQNKAAYEKTTFRIKENGEGIYLMDGEEIPEKKFRELHPIGLIDFSKHGLIDGRRSFYKD